MCGETPVISLKLVRAKEGAKLQQGIDIISLFSTSVAESTLGVRTGCADQVKIVVDTGFL